MTSVRFREMTRQDLHAVAKIEMESQSHPWSLLQFVDCFNAGNTGWVVCKQRSGVEVIAGFAIVSAVLDEASLLNFCVRPAWQNQGVGRSMLEFLLMQARAGNIKRYFLDVRASNEVAIHLYESLGFKRISVRKDYYPAFVGREDGLVYSLSLTPSSAAGSPSS